MNLTRQIILAGSAGTLITLIIILYRRHTIDGKGIALALGGFLFAANFPPSIFLCSYAFTPDDAISKTRLAGYEWYLFFAGMASFLFGLDSLFSIFRQANKVESKPDAK